MPSSTTPTPATVVATAIASTVTATPPVKDETNPNYHPVEMSKWMFSTFWWLFILGCIIGVIATFKNPANGFYLIVAGVYLFMSYVTVEAEFEALVKFLGMPVHIAKPGPTFVPWLLGKYKLVPKGTQNTQFPGKPEKIFHGGDDKDLPKDPPGMLRPIRIMTGSKDEKPLTGPDTHLAKQMALEFFATLFWRIDKPADFWVRIDGHTWEDKKVEADERLQEMYVSVLTAWCIKYTAAGVIENIVDIRREVVKTLQEVTLDWGIQILQLSQPSPDLNHGPTKAISGIVVASADAQAKTLAAAGERTRLREEATGKAEGNAKDIELTGLALKKAADAVGMKPEEYARLILGQQMIKDSDKIILGADGITEGLLGVAAALAKK